MNAKVVNSRIWGCLLFLMLIVQSFGMPVMGAGIDFAGGNGTLESPYLIENADQLNNVRNYLDKHFKLTADIDLNVAPYNEGLGWEPMGGQVGFTGTFDGNNKSITGLFINRPEKLGGVGLFQPLGSADEVGVVRDLKLLDVDVTGLNWVGGLAGQNFGTIINVKVTGTVTGVTEVGGLVGNNIGSITHSRALVTVTGVSEVGGLAAQNLGPITNSYAMGTVSGTKNYVGGLVARNILQGTITNSYATGAVSGLDDVGALVGTNGRPITNSYATGAVSSPGLAGGLTSYNVGYISNSFYNYQTTGAESGVGMGDQTGVTGLSTAQMKQQGSFEGWDFPGTWMIDSDTFPYLQWQEEHKDSVPPAFANGYPFVGSTSNNALDLLIQVDEAATAYYVLLPGGKVAPRADQVKAGTDADGGAAVRSGSIPLAANLPETAVIIGLTPGTVYDIYVAAENAAGNMYMAKVEGAGIDFAGGNGTPETPYLVENADQLNNVRNYLDKHFKLTADIDLNVAPYNEGLGWEPIGGQVGFTGTFDGNNKSISGLFINRPERLFGVGLFQPLGNADEVGVLRDLKLLDVDVTGLNWVGGLAGQNFGTITNVKVTGTVTGATEVGGLVGNNIGSITHSRALVTVTGVSEVGGLAAKNLGPITSSYAMGTVSGTGNYVGGLVSSNISPGTITDSYATGAVSGLNDVGALVGFNGRPITNSYATGAVSSPGLAGGLVSQNHGNGYISNSIYNYQTTGKESGVGMGDQTGVTGLSTAQMKQQGSFAGWDFPGTWMIDSDTFPYLQWQEEHKDSVPPAFANGYPLVSASAPAPAPILMGTLGGTVRTDAGLPAAGVKVELRQDESADPLSSTTADANGRFDFGARAAGDYTVYVPIPEFPASQQVAVLANGLSETTVVLQSRVSLTLTAAPSVLVGDGLSSATLGAALMRHDGTPVPNVTVHFATTAGTFKANQVLTGHDGRAVATLTAPAMDEIVARDEKLRVFVADPDQGFFAETSFDIRFLPASISGLVVAATTGKPLAGAIVEIREGSYLAKVETGLDGRYRIPVPRGNQPYSPTVTVPMPVNGRTVMVTTTHPVAVGPVARGTDYPADRKIGGQLLITDERSGQTKATGQILPAGVHVEATLRNTEGKPLDKPVRLHADGSFEVEKVAVGQYQILFQLFSPDSERMESTVVHFTVEQEGILGVLTPLIDFYGDTTDPGTAIPIPESPSTPTVAPAEPLAGPPTELTDVRGHWAEADIRALTALGVVRGMPDQTFQPESRVTRAEFSVMLIRVLGLTSYPARELPFSDDEEIDDWARGPIAAMVQYGLTAGYADKSFRPQSPISRAEVAVLIIRALSHMGITLMAPPDQAFADQVSTPAWAEPSIRLAAAAGIVGGFPDGTFRPAEQATRAQAAVMIRRMMRQMDQ